MQVTNSNSTAMIDALVAAAHDRKPVSGWTHNFYRYPARFSPTFAAAAIECFTKPGDLVLDPYVGGGTSVVEALARGRQSVGNDLNSLAVFITTVKTTPLLEPEAASLREWADTVVPSLSYWTPREHVATLLEDHRTKNLNLPRARFIKKTMAIALSSINRLSSANAQAFARCAVLRTAQWALDGRRGHTRLSQFRAKLTATVHDMLSAISSFGHRVQQSRGSLVGLSNLDAAAIRGAPCFVRGKTKAHLVITSPPYPGVHVLYHRWQVDGRRETPAPYWVSACNDGQSASYYNFGDRRERTLDTYFDSSLRTLSAIHDVMAPRGVMVQLVAFSEPHTQLPRYLRNMEAAGFTEWTSAVSSPDRRIWREVPNRKWHAALKGKTHSSREVVLIHVAV